MLVIWEILKERGIRQAWLAQKLGVSEAYISLLRSGKRQWTDDLQGRAAQVLMLPRSILFLSVDPTLRKEHQICEGLPLPDLADDPDIGV